MQLTQLRIRNFRCISDAELAPEPGINLIVGDNASGKSSLLEAIYFLGRGQSFRGTPSDRLIRHGERELSVHGKLREGDAPATAIGILRSNHQTRIKLGAQDNTSLAELVSTLPIQVIDPRLHQLLEEGPEQRRRFLDWGVFHVEQAFYPAWLRYQRALRQRNRALHSADTPSAQRWDLELAAQAQHLDAARRHYLETLAGILPGIMNELLPGADISTEYHPGWPAEWPFAEALARGIERDREMGHTQAGPHRADLKIRLQGRQARTRASRGEQKLISAGLLLAQAALLRRDQQRQPLLLIDDLAAELDRQSRDRLFAAITALGTQSFLSFLDPAQIPPGHHRAAMFHVEHGRFSRVS